MGIRPGVACSSGIAIALLMTSPLRATWDGEPISEHIEIRFPLPPCGIGPWVVRVLDLMHIPSGVESIPDCQRLTIAARPRLPGPPDVDLFGLTAEEALDRLLQIDPRFRLLTDDGVIVVRPAAAWDDTRHFMHQPIDALRFTDNNYVGALQAFEMIVFHPPWHRDPEAWRRVATKAADGEKLFSVDVPAPTGLIAADAIVRAHGALRWSLGYCGPEPRPEYASFGVFTLDHRDGGAFHLTTLDANGRLYDACNPRRDVAPKPRPR